MQTNLFLATVLTTQMLVNALMTTDIHTSDFFSITGIKQQDPGSLRTAL